MSDITSIVPVSRCPHCGLSLDPAAWRDNGRGPEAGDLTICQGCAHILRFDRRLRLTPLTERDERTIHRTDPQIFAQVKRIASQLLTKAGISPITKLT